MEHSIRKIFSLIIAGIMLFSLTACGSDMSALQQQVNDLQERVEVLEYQISELEEKNAAVQMTETTDSGSEAAADECETPTDDESGSPADFTEDQKIVYSTVMNFKETPAYIKIAQEPETIRVLHAVHLITRMEEEQMELMLIDCEADKEIYGVDAGILAVDLSDNTVYDMNNLDINNYSGQLDTHEDRIKMCFGSYSSIRGGANQDIIGIISDMDVMFVLSADELEQVNQALNQ